MIAREAHSLPCPHFMCGRSEECMGSYDQGRIKSLEPFANTQMALLWAVLESL